LTVTFIVSSIVLRIWSCSLRSIFLSSARHWFTRCRCLCRTGLFCANRWISWSGWCYRSCYQIADCSG
jgi:hypothetical protein